MRNLTHHLYESFYYTRAERNASIVLANLCLVFFLLPNFYPYILPPKPPTDFSEFRAAIIAATADRSIADNKSTEEQPNFRNDKTAAIPVETFRFDPNTATKDELVRLGISSRTAQTLLNYRSKGGRFFKKEDLKKVYGLRQEDYDRLEEWVIIETEHPVILQKKKQKQNREVVQVSETVAEEKRKSHFTQQERI